MKKQVAMVGDGEEAGNNHSAKGYLWQLFSVPANIGRRDQSILNLRKLLIWDNCVLQNGGHCTSKWRALRFKMEGIALQNGEHCASKWRALHFKMEDIHMIKGTLKQRNRMTKASVADSPDPSHQQVNHPPLFYYPSMYTQWSTNKNMHSETVT